MPSAADVASWSASGSGGGGRIAIYYDAMTLPDIVFPAFLFIAGVSIPLALSRAAALGQSRGELFWKVLVRTLALLTMGVAMVNMEEHEPWYRGLWGLLAYLAMLLAFAVVPRQAGPAPASGCDCPGAGCPSCGWHRSPWR